MDPALELAIELHEAAWKRFRAALDDLTPDEVDWRPLAQANSINLIVRHLRIEAEWHLGSLARGEPMPSEPTPSVQQQIDATPLDFAANLKALTESFTAFLAALRQTTLPALEQQTTLAYQGKARTPHFLGFHQVLHLAGHLGQISTIRNLYRKTRGEPARFFPENPTFPK